MAGQIPHCVLVSVINKLASLAFDEMGRIYGVTDELERLKATLESIRVVLSDAEQRRENPVIEPWICRFKQVLHDADDLAIKDLRRKVGGRRKSKVRAFFSSENPLVFRAELAREIEKIRKNYNDVAEDVSKLKLNSSVVVLKQDETVWRETSTFVLESEIIGREEDKNHIIAFCDKLESLPEAMRCLTNLQTLSIHSCRLLEGRCQAETGQDWPKIAHIPNILI